MKRCSIALITLVAILVCALQHSAFSEPQVDIATYKATFVFPSSLQMIDEEAFIGTAAKSVILPDGFVCIGNGAFSNNQSLTDVYIPQTTQNISETAFSSASNLVIHGIERSYANEWADEHQISFVNEDIWKLICDNSNTINAREFEIGFLYRIIQPNRISRIIPRTENENESKRPQDRPELNPIDYRFP